MQPIQAIDPSIIGSKPIDLFANDKDENTVNLPDVTEKEKHRSEAEIKLLTGAVLTGPGETELELRKAIEARVAELGGSRRPKSDSDVPPELESYVDKVGRHAYKVTDDDIEKLKSAGYSEDAIFEITLSAALGAGPW